MWEHFGTMSGRAFAPRLGRSLSAPALPSCGGHAHLSSLCEGSRCSHTWDSTNYEYKNGFSDTNYRFGIDTSPALARIVAPALVGASAGVCNVGCEVNVAKAREQLFPCFVRKNVSTHAC